MIFSIFIGFSQKPWKYSINVHVATGLKFPISLKILIILIQIFYILLSVSVIIS